MLKALPLPGRSEPTPVYGVIVIIVILVVLVVLVNQGSDVANATAAIVALAATGADAARRLLHSSAPSDQPGAEPQPDA